MSVSVSPRHAPLPLGSAALTVPFLFPHYPFHPGLYPALPIVPLTIGVVVWIIAADRNIPNLVSPISQKAAEVTHLNTSVRGVANASFCRLEED